MAVKDKELVWFGMKVTPQTKQKIRKLAKRKGVSMKEALVTLVEQETQEEPIKPTPGSFYDKHQDSCGMFEGPRDLSSNPKKYMKGFGK